MHASTANAVRRRRTAAIFTVAGAAALAAGCASVSLEQEQQLGDQYAQQINAELPVVNDRAINDYLNQLGRQLAASDRRGIRYSFFLVNAEQVNAFAIPGGYVYVNRGLIEHADNMSELAGVLAHEIGHVVERHSVEQLERAQNANLGLNLAYILMGRNPGAAEQAAIGVGGGLVFARYGREAEDEADQVAIPLMVNAGVNPNGLLTFFEELMEQQSRSPTALEAWFSTHPTTQDRIDATRARLSRLPAAQRRGTTDTNAFQAFKRRVASLPAPPPEYRTGN